MPFTKGDKNINKGGRPKGSGNKIDQNIKDMLQGIYDGNLANIQSDLDNMSPKDKWATLNKMSDKFLPSLKAVDQKISVGDENTSLGFSINYSDDVESNDDVNVDGEGEKEV